VIRPARSHPGWWAFIVHRISGVALAFFLPAHFLALGTALQGEARLDAFLRWSEQPLVKLAEWILVMLLAAHLAGGLRLLALEFLPWREWHKALAALAAAFAVAAGLVFALAR
jgi:fumarate reductase subunit D